MKMSAVSLERARRAKRHATELFEHFGTVVGTGIVTMNGGYGIKINLQEEPVGVVLPDRVEDVPVRVEIVGAVHKLGASALKGF